MSYGNDFKVLYLLGLLNNKNIKNKPDWNTGKPYFTVGNVNSLCNAVVVSPNIYYDFSTLCGIR